MSYESAMLKRLAMPARKDVERVLLRTLLKHGGTVKEFGSRESIVAELADEYGLSEHQRSAYLETVYRKENRLKKSPLWHRLLFRAADALARESLVSRPADTLRLTKKREWMLTEKGVDAALGLCDIPFTKKNDLQIKSYEVQKIVKHLIESPAAKNYDPIDYSKKLARITRESVLRSRGFRQAVIEVYSFRCAVCGLKIQSPSSLTWEVQAAHFVPNSSKGRDDLCNGIALCRLHHWAFDVGWFTLSDDYKIHVSEMLHSLPRGFGKIDDYEVFRSLASKQAKISLPTRNELYPHRNAILWHRQFVFNQGL